MDANVVPELDALFSASVLLIELLCLNTQVFRMESCFRYPNDPKDYIVELIC